MFRWRHRLPEHLKKMNSIEGMLSNDEADLLYQLARQVGDGCIVEVGAYRGRSTVVLALGAEAGCRPKVYTIDPHESFVGILGGHFGPEDRGAFYRNMLRSSCYRTVRLLNTRSEIVAPGWREPVGLLWIDGDHSYDAVRRDFGCWEPHLTGNARIAFHDARNAELGPARVLGELVATGRYRKQLATGDVVVICRRRSA